MPFGALLDHLEQGSELYYMTTQPLGTSDDGRPNLMAQPVASVTWRGACIASWSAADGGLPAAAVAAAGPGSRVVQSLAWTCARRLVLRSVRCAAPLH